MSEKYSITLPYDFEIDEHLREKFPSLSDFRIIHKSLDARGAPRGKKPKYHYTIEVIRKEKGDSWGEQKEQFSSIDTDIRPIIVGAGPAGLFAALRFSEYGIKTHVIERGESVSKRMKDISKYWRRGELNEENNVCFGEGGAGLFSDGKLVTRIKSHYIEYVMNKFVEFGAPEEVAYQSNPHVGSNKLRGVISNISDWLKKEGHRFSYNSRVDELVMKEHRVAGVRLSDGTEILSPIVIMGTGHSAKNIYHHFSKINVGMKAKDFAIGVRIEHERTLIDSLQFGKFAGDDRLGTARYKLSYHSKSSGRGTYSFCMCPGGYVLPSSTEKKGIVINGMSNSAQNAHWSNSALIVSVKANKDFDGSDPLAGLAFQEEIEKKAYENSLKYASGKEVPAMTLKNFLHNYHKRENLEMIRTSCPSGIVSVPFSDIFPPFILQHLKESFSDFNKKMKGYSDKNSQALLLAPETRTSSPITILRDTETLESSTHLGLYPAGEGAGFSGGITSSAVDGIRVVESIIREKLS